MFQQVNAQEQQLAPAPPVAAAAAAAVPVEPGNALYWACRPSEDLWPHPTLLS